ncbi:MAG: hypothetical protein PHE89_02105 [Alphaproteobacteria bacterium]|nr:hypothetical protein [Alphaproteobacteria bacterium]
MNKHAITILKLIIAIFITYYAIEDISAILLLTDKFSLSFSESLYVVSNVFMFIIAWSMVFKKIDTLKITSFLAFVLIAFSMSFYNAEIRQKLDWSDCYDAGKSWDTIENRCRYDCASWTEETGCAKMFDPIDEKGLVED